MKPTKPPESCFLSPSLGDAEDTGILPSGQGFARRTTQSFSKKFPSARPTKARLPSVTLRKVRDKGLEGSARMVMLWL